MARRSTLHRGMTEWPEERVGARLAWLNGEINLITGALRVYAHLTALPRWMSSHFSFPLKSWNAQLRYVESGYMSFSSAGMPVRRKILMVVPAKSQNSFGAAIFEFSEFEAEHEVVVPPPCLVTAVEVYGAGDDQDMLKSKLAASVITCLRYVGRRAILHVKPSDVSCRVLGRLSRPPGEQPSWGQILKRAPWLQVRPCCKSEI